MNLSEVCLVSPNTSSTSGNSVRRLSDKSEQGLHWPPKSGLNGATSAIRALREPPTPTLKSPPAIFRTVSLGAWCIGVLALVGEVLREGDLVALRVGHRGRPHEPRGSHDRPGGYPLGLKRGQPRVGAVD